MLILMEEKATQQQLDEVMQRVRSLNLECHSIAGEKGWVIGAVGPEGNKPRIQVLECLPGGCLGKAQFANRLGGRKKHFVPGHAHPG